MSASEAVARRLRPRPAAPAVADGTSILTAGVHVTSPTHTQRFDVSPSGRKGSGEGASAKQGRPGLWTDEELDELRRLVGIHTNAQGRVSWVEVEKDWRELNLSERSRASLTTKWRGIKNTAPTSETADDHQPVQSQLAVVTSAQSRSFDIATPTDAPVVSDSAVGNNVFSQSPTITTTTAVVTDNTVAVEEIKSTFYKHLKISKKIGCKPNRRKAPRRVTEKMVQPIIREVDRLIELELDMENRGKPTWDKLSIVVYAGAMTVSELVNRKFKEQINRSKEWFQNARKEVHSLHVTIGKATAELNRRKKCRNIKISPLQASNIHLLERRYNVTTYAEITSLVERLKVRLRLLRSRIKLREEDERRIRIRKLPTKLALRGIDTPSNTAPDVNQIRKYWKGIVGMEKQFNSDEEHLVSWEKSLVGRGEEDNLDERLSPELWQEVTRKAKPWKAHGPDGLQSFWWKAFKTAGAALYKLARFHLTTGSSLPKDWLTVGRIVLIHKAGSHDDPANYRPIACLNTCYKLLTSFVTAYLHQYVKERGVLPEEQVALRKGVWGCTHALILDQTLIADALNQRQHPISVAWIDYAKAFDSLPHSYIKWLISALQVPKPLGEFIKKLINSWRIRYEVRDPQGKTHRSNYLRVKSGVLQGDSFSPLLFCIAMAPISHAINSLKCGYKTAFGKSKNMQIELSHLFYMDDLKLYGSSLESLTEMVEMVDTVSTAINMKMNTKKCAVANFVPKRLRDDDGVGSDQSSESCLGFPSLNSGELYKYLGIEQNLGTKESEAWDRVKEKCCKAVTQIWSSDLTFRQKVNSFNTTVIPALSYIVSNTIKGSGKFRSVLERGEKLDKKFRRMLVELKVRYKASCVDRLYLTTELGGCGLKSVETSLEEAVIYSWAYLCTRTSLRNSLKLFVSMAKRTKRSVISDAEHVMSKHKITAELEPDHSTVILDGTRFTDARLLARCVVEKMRLSNNIRRRKVWEAKVLAGRVLRSTDNIALGESFLWIRDGKLSAVAVRNVIAAQEGCLITKSHPCCAGKFGNVSCRACGRSTETIEHVLTGCSKWLPTLYIDRHDSVARSLHYRLCLRFQLAPQHYSQRVESVKENDRVKLYWNQPVQTRAIIRHNKPDIVIFEKADKKATIIEFAVSWFTGIGRQIEIKRNRYCVNGNYEDELNTPYPCGENLFRELQAEGWQVTFVPVVIGACGEVISGLSDQLRSCLGISQREAEDCIERMERSAALGSSRIIKSHLAMAC